MTTSKSIEPELIGQTLDDDERIASLESRLREGIKDFKGQIHICFK